MGVLTVKSRNIEGWLLFKIKQINNTEEMKKKKSSINDSNFC